LQTKLDLAEWPAPMQQVPGPWTFLERLQWFGKMPNLLQLWAPFLRLPLQIPVSTLLGLLWQPVSPGGSPRFPWASLPVPISPGLNFCALWQPTHPRVAARFPSFSTRKESMTREAGRVSPWRPLASRVASSARAGLLVVRPSPPRHPVDATPASRRRHPGSPSPLPLRLLIASVTPTVRPPHPTSLCLPLGFRIS